MSTLGNVPVKIGVNVEPSEEFCDVAWALGFVRVVPCFDCVYAGTPECPMKVKDKDSMKHTTYFCSQGRRDDAD